MSIRGQEVEIALLHRDTAMPDVLTRTPRVHVMPYLMAGPGIDRPDIFWNREVENAIHQQRRRLDQRSLVGLKRPSQAQILHVARCDLSQCAVSPSGIIAVVTGPTVGGRMQKGLFIGSLRKYP